MNELKQVLKRMFSLDADTASHEEIKKRIISGGQVTGTNMCILICAILIASAQKQAKKRAPARVAMQPRRAR